MLAAKNTKVSGLTAKRPLAAGFAMSANAQSEDTSHLDAFLAAAHRRKYPAKSTLIYAGDKSDSIYYICLLYTSPSPRDQRGSRMPSSA